MPLIQQNLQSPDFTRSESPKPFLKWVGGKRQIMAHLKDSMPARYNRYFEPFVGGGALFFELQPQEAFLSDSNAELMDTYRALRDDVEGVIRHLKHHCYSESHYYAVRAQSPARMSLAGRAARMIYLNRSGYNGLYRVNSQGRFNVPFGRHKNPRICNEEHLRAVSQALSNVHLQTESFEHVVEAVKPGDFVYLDPPYIPISNSAYFVAYQQDGFDMSQQEQLAAVFETLHQKGCYVMLSNSNVPWMQERYGAFGIRKVTATRSVNSKASARGPVGELIVTNY